MVLFVKLRVRILVVGLSGIAGDDSNVLPILRAVSRRITRKSLTVSAEYFAR